MSPSLSISEPTASNPFPVGFGEVYQLSIVRLVQGLSAAEEAPGFSNQQRPSPCGSPGPLTINDPPF